MNAITMKAVSAAAVLALTAALGMSFLAASAEARPIFIEYDDIRGEARDNMDESGDSKTAGEGESRAAAGVCCSLPRRGTALMKPRQCRKAKGAIVPLKQCPQKAKRPGRTKYGNITLKRG